MYKFNPSPELQGDDFRNMFCAFLSKQAVLEAEDGVQQATEPLAQEVHTSGDTLQAVVYIADIMKGKENSKKKDMSLYLIWICLLSAQLPLNLAQKENMEVEKFTLLNYSAQNIPEVQKSNCSNLEAKVCPDDALFWSVSVAIPTIGTQYSMFQAAPAAKMIEDGKIHAVEHIISPIAVQQDPTSAAAAAAAAAAAVIPSVSTPPPFQGRPITPVYTMAPNVQRIPAAGIYGASYVPFAAPATATIATLQKNAAAAAAAAAYGGYAGYIPQAFPAATIQVPIHDVYQTY
ncbi:hypothetical protein JD844_027210 [Phrynosoma platyrhinos]|uniref:Uncharacterized protein n=1 Tax=Phrynosoma platyrhinos TaxID=52577 RepID=A0ABQ7SG02_PHRPL|nr:hypothetical protein JD844_027210 [Phrynosoma platyrhinos]